MSRIATQRQDPTRRTFLGAAGAVAAAGVLGAAPAAFAGEGATSASASADGAWDGEYDVIVVGAGLAGLTAAATVAAEGNGATCLLLEKGETPIGNSKFAFGMISVIGDPDDAMVYMNALQEGTDSTPEDVLRAFCDESSKNYSWMVETLGAPEADFMTGGPELWPEEARQANPAVAAMSPEYPELENIGGWGFMAFTGAGGVSGFTNICDFLMNYVETRSDVIDYQPATPMSELVTDGDGAVIGLIVEDGRRFKANKGVVMCCGGFESDPGMLFDSTGVKGAFPAAGMGNTGDGHRACAKVGAGMWHMHCVSGFWETTRSLDNTRFLQFGPGEGSGPGNYTKDRGITVGMNGQRFYMDWDANTSGGLYPMGSDLTVNIGYRHGYTQWGGQWGPMRMPETAWFVFDANALANGAVPTDLSADPVADGFAYVSDTIEGLAEQCGVPADELANTVAVWNQFCADGEDLAFHRPANTLTEVVTPPFYAVRCAPHFLNTNGGPARSAKGEVLDAFGAPIPGLYSAGEFGSIWGALYQAAGNLAECCAFGRISARSALGR